MPKLNIFMRNIEGGVATYIRDFLQYRSEALFYVKLILVTDDEAGIDRVRDDFNANEIINFYYSRYENIHHVLKRLSKHVKHPDEIILANEGMELTMMDLFRLPNKLINIIHGDSPYYYNNVAKYSGLVDGFIGTSDWISNKAKRLVTEGSRKSLVRKIFAPVKYISPGMEKEGSICRLIYVGRIEEAKGAHHIIGICEELDKMQIPYLLTMAGSGSLIPALEREKAKLKGEIKFTGFLSNDQVLALLRNSQIMLFPSYSEAVGLAVVEAMKAGVIPVTSDLNSGLPEIVINGLTGFRVKIGDEKGFAGKVAYLYHHPERMHKMRMDAIKLANDQFDPLKQTREIEAFIKMISESSFNKDFNNGKYGFRLDSKYLPNAATVFLRRLIALVRGSAIA